MKIKPFIVLAALTPSLVFAQARESGPAEQAIKEWFRLFLSRLH